MSAGLRFDPLDEWELDNHLMHRGPEGHFDYRKAIYVKPPATERDSVAAIWCHWKFDLERPKCGFYWGVWSTRRERTVFPRV